MTKQGLKVAIQHASSLPQYPSLADAQRELFALRDQRLCLVQSWADASPGFSADRTPQSLKALEAWYFEPPNPPTAAASDPLDVASAIGVYLGQVLVEHGGFTWVVTESPFQAGHFEIGVTKGLFTLMLTCGCTPEPLERNRRKQSLFRMFQKYSA